MRVAFALISTTLALHVSACAEDQQAEEPVEVQQQEQEEAAQGNAEAEALDMSQEAGVLVEDATIAEDAAATEVDPMVAESFTDGDAQAEATPEEVEETPSADLAAVSYMVDKPEESNIPPGSTEAFPGEVMWVDVDIANVRSAPALDAPVVGKLRFGARVPVHGRLNGWVRIGEGKHLSITVLSKIDPYWGKKGALHFVTSPDLNIRAKPEFGSPIIGRLTKGEVVAVRKRFPNGWVQIDDGRFVNGAFLSRRKPNVHQQALSH